MLFRKNISRSCTYCQYSTTVCNGQMLCSKRGVVSVDYNCRSFRYHPCKRIPPKMKAPDLQKYQDVDFSL